eukprot:COSAG06_NODE_4044_length_4634_cov_9.897023_3_plen_59_part_00
MSIPTDHRLTSPIKLSTEELRSSPPQEPLYKAGGHPAGLDKCEAHKVQETPFLRHFIY